MSGFLHGMEKNDVGGAARKIQNWPNVWHPAIEDLIAHVRETGDINALNVSHSMYFCPFAEAISIGNKEWVKAMIQLGVNLRPQRPVSAADGRGFLHAAAEIGKDEIGEILIEHGFSPNEQDVKGVTPLMVAAQKGHVPMIKVLQEKGADPLIRDNKGKTAFDYSLEKHHILSALQLKHIKPEVAAAVLGVVCVGTGYGVYRLVKWLKSCRKIN